MKFSTLRNFTVLLLVCLCGLPGSILRAASSDWNDLKVLKSGQLVGVETKDGTSYEGPFKDLSNTGITFGGSDD